MSNYERIPSELRELNQWGIYKREWDEDRQKWKKKPHNPFNGKLGSSTNEGTWSDFRPPLMLSINLKQMDWHSISNRHTLGLI